jgi:hypothetical protein
MFQAQYVVRATSSAVPFDDALDFGQKGGVFLIAVPQTRSWQRLFTYWSSHIDHGRKPHLANACQSPSI